MSSINQFEIILGIVGGVGTEFDKIIKELCCKFEHKECLVKVIKLTDFLKIDKGDSKSYVEHAHNKTEFINNKRKKHPGFMAYIAVNQIF